MRGPGRANEGKGDVWVWGVLLVGLTVGCALAGGQEKPWPLPVEGWKKPEAGEHPRLFFRKGEWPEIRKRAQTPEGQTIVNRLRLLLNGSDGESLPQVFNPTKVCPNNPGGLGKEPLGKVFTLWHAAGYGMLYHLTGDKKFADLSRQSVEKMLEGQVDRDSRYSFMVPNGALRAGPSLGAMAMAYDLGYDGWDDAFRQKVAKAIEQGPPKYPTENLVNGRRHGPQSNHWGCQVGGGALAVLAIRGDPGTDQGKLDGLWEDSSKAMIRQLSEGFGDGGFYWEGKGPGGIGSDTAFIPALQAWRVAGGRDFITPRPNAAAITLLKVHELLIIQGKPWYLIPRPSGYGTGFFGVGWEAQSDRCGISRAGQFAQGFGAIPDQVKPAALWVYNHIVEKDPATRTYDTVSACPHRAVLALVNWPLGLPEANPASLLPKVAYDDRLGGYSFRNQWTGTEDDIAVNFLHRARDPHPAMVWGKGQKLNFAACPKGPTTHFQPAEDGSGTLTAGGWASGVDFSKASGAEALVVISGPGATGQKTIQAGGKTFALILLGGSPPEPKVEGAKVIIGGQGIAHDGQKILFDRMAGPPAKPRFGCW